jgi:hypothetical protein
LHRSRHAPAWRGSLFLFFVFRIDHGGVFSRPTLNATGFLFVAMSRPQAIAVEESLRPWTSRPESNIFAAMTHRHNVDVVMRSKKFGV